jgi:hypothetical protein
MIASPLYGSPPWHLAGRAFSILCRLDDPDEAGRHVPDVLSVDRDPLVKIRFWDLIHDSGFGEDGRSDAPPLTIVREAVLAFPVRYGLIEGDFPAYMYADDPIYSAFGRETMGWPLRDGNVGFDTMWPGAPLVEGTMLSAGLARRGRPLMNVSLTLTGRVTDDGEVTPPPRWFAVRRIPDLASPTDSIRELALTGPSRFRRGPVHEARGAIDVVESAANELGWFRPRVILGAELWSDVYLTIGYGHSLADLRG